MVVNPISNKNKHNYKMVRTSVKIDAWIASDIKKVWHCWTQPEHITKWNFASEDWYCPSASNELTVGGKYTARMEARDGSFGFDFEAIYDEIVEHNKISYTMPDGRKVTTTFEADNGATNVTTVFDAESMNPVEMQQAGWQAILNNFKKYVEAN
ncbi:SRPBCC family protein [Saprospiraceae bacterium]